MSVPECYYKVKRVEFFERECPIILQNENGPCPLIAMANVLLLRNAIEIRGQSPEISLQDLMALVAGRLLDANTGREASHGGQEWLANQEQNISDAIALLPKLATGLDVNVKFTGPTDFEYTSECAIFDLLDISLVHGWVVDPQDEPSYSTVKRMSYNQLVERVVNLHSAASAKAPEPKAPPATPPAPVAPPPPQPPSPSTEEDDLLQRALAMSLEDGGDGQATVAGDPVPVPTEAAPAAAAPPLDDPFSGLTDVADPFAGLAPLLPEPGPVPSPLTGGAEAEGAVPAPGDVAGAVAAPPSPSAVLEGLGDDDLREAIPLVPAAAPETPAAAHPPPPPPPSPPAPERALSPGEMQEMATLESFLESTASQLTYYGLAKLHEAVKERELCVFFRNNHFNTVFKMNGGLYILATDDGFRSEPNLVWERLLALDNDTEFTTGKFERFTDKHTAAAAEEARKKVWEADAATRAASLLSEAAGGGAGAGGGAPALPAAAAAGGGAGAGAGAGAAAEAGAVGAEEMRQVQQAVADADFAYALQLQQEEEQRAEAQQRVARQHESEAAARQAQEQAWEQGRGGREQQQRRQQHQHQQHQQQQQQQQHQQQQHQQQHQQQQQQQQQRQAATTRPPPRAAQPSHGAAGPGAPGAPARAGQGRGARGATGTSGARREEKTFKEKVKEECCIQ